MLPKNIITWFQLKKSRSFFFHLHYYYFFILNRQQWLSSVHSLNAYRISEPKHREYFPFFLLIPIIGIPDGQTIMRKMFFFFFSFFVNITFFLPGLRLFFCLQKTFPASDAAPSDLSRQGGCIFFWYTFFSFQILHPTPIMGIKYNKIPVEFETVLI